MWLLFILSNKSFFNKQTKQTDMNSKAILNTVKHNNEKGIINAISDYIAYSLRKKKRH